MGLFKFIEKFKNDRAIRQYAKMMNGYTPVFSQFGKNVYASDIVQNAIGCIANDMSKLCPKHIRIDPENELQHIVNDELNRLLKFGPNPLMTTSDFIAKIVYKYEIEKNVFIYPSFEKIKIDDNHYKRYYTGLWPLNPQEVDFLEDSKGKLFIKFHFGNGEDYTFPYEDIIHWRKDFTENDFMGGDSQGRANNSALLKLLNANHTIMQGIEHGVKAPLAVRGIVKVNTMLDDEEQEKKREEFEAKMTNSKSGILAIDLKSDFIPIKIDPKFIDKDTMEFIENRILANYGVSLPIYNSKFNEEDYQAYYEKTLEPMIISLGRAFSKVLFTKRQLEIGHEVIFYQQGLMYMSTKNKIDAVNILTNLGTLTDNQVLSVFGYPPFEGGDARRMSLNYINRDIADQYQLQKTTPRKESEKGE